MSLEGHRDFEKIKIQGYKTTWKVTISLLWSHFKNTEIGDYKEPEAGDVVVENLGALLLLEQVGGEQPQLHDHTGETGRDLPLQEKETALRGNGQDWGEMDNLARESVVTFASEAFPWSSRCLMEIGAGEYLSNKAHCVHYFFINIVSSNTKLLIYYDHL